MNVRPVYVSPVQLHKSAERVNLVCGFYGPTHPKCKKAISDDYELYMKFLNQLKIDDDVDDTSES
jgi:hypothetical protein